MDVLARVAKTLLVLVLILLALVAAFLAVLRFTDWSEHKDFVASVIERFSGWEVEQLGDIQVELFFPTEIVVDDVKLTQAAPDSALVSASADHFEIRLDPMSPLLNERLVIHSIQASGARLVVQQTAEQSVEEQAPLNLPYVGSARIRDTEILYQGTQGTRDWHGRIDTLDLTSREKGQGVSIAATGELEGINFNVDGTTGALENLTAPDAPLPVSLQGAVAGDDVALQGTVEMPDGGVTFDLEFAAKGDNLSKMTSALGVSLTDVPPYQIRFAARKSAEEVVVDQLQLSLGSSRLSGNASLRIDEPTPRLQVDLQSSLLRQQDILSLVPERKEGEAAQAAQAVSPLAILEGWSADVEFDLAQYQGGELGSVISSATLQAKLEEAVIDTTVNIDAGGLSFSLTGTAGPPQQGEVLPFDLQFSAADDTFSAEGKVNLSQASPSLEMSASAEGDSLEQLAQLFDLSLARVPPYKAEFSTSLSGGSVALSGIKLTVGRSYLYGDASLRFSDPRPYLNADLGMSLLRKQDVVSFAFAEQESEAGPDQFLFPREPLPLDVLAQLDADFEIAIARYEGEPLGPVVSGLTVRANLEKGKLTLDPVELLLAGGSIDGSLAVNSAVQPAAFNVDLAAENISLSELVTAFIDVPGTEKTVRGEVAASLELTSSGNTAHELAARADGNFKFAVYDGVMPAVIVEGLGLDITEAAVSWFGETNPTEIKCALGSFAIDSGVLDTEALVIATKDSNIIGKGQINLEQETIDYRLEAHAKDFSILAVDAPIQIKGELTDISVGLVSGEFAATLGAAALAALVNPLLAVAPFIELGIAETDRCSDLRNQLQKVRQESPKQ